jgi:hypothetical protein
MTKVFSAHAVSVDGYISGRRWKVFATLISCRT